MAFNPAAETTLLDRAQSGTRITSWEQAKEVSITQHFDKQIEDIAAGKLYIPGSGSAKNPPIKAPQNPSCWAMKAADGKTYVCWRIMNKPVYWNETQAKALNGWMVCDDPASKLAEIREYIASGGADSLMKETFERPLRRKKKAMEAPTI